jgi:hypothetical protein
MAPTTCGAWSISGAAGNDRSPSPNAEPFVPHLVATCALPDAADGIPVIYDVTLPAAPRRGRGNRRGRVRRAGPRRGAGADGIFEVHPDPPRPLRPLTQFSRPAEALLTAARSARRCAMTVLL